MQVVTQDFLNSNEFQAYPIDVRASFEAYSTADKSAVNSILTDMRITIPYDLAACVFITNINITSHLITMTFMGAKDHPFSPNTPSAVTTYYISNYATAGAIVLATLQVKRTSNMTGTTVSLTPLAPGVGGWVVLGSGAAVLGQWVFSGPLSSMISDRCVTRYNYTGVKTIGKLGFDTTLNGHVNFVGQNGLEFSTDSQGLALKLSGTKSEIKANLESYIGKCGARPESKNCISEPIRTINAITPGGPHREIILILDKPLYARLIQPTTPYEVFKVSSDLPLEKFCAGRINAPPSCTATTWESQVTLTSSEVSTTPILVPADGIELTFEVYGEGISATANFKYSQQSAANPSIAIFTTTKTLYILGEVLSELQIDLALGEWQLSGNSGVSMFAYGTLYLNLRGYKQIRYMDKDYEISLGISTIYDVLEVKSVNVTIDPPQVFAEEGTYVRSSYSKYVHSQNPDYTLEVRKGESDTWTILRVGVLLAAGTLDSKGVGAQVQSYIGDTGKSLLRTIGVKGVLSGIS
jgi:hypothetical protein